MFQGLKSKLNDMGTVKLLCERAETHALLDQQREPGAEHFLLAALDLPDGTARLAFEKVGAEPDALKAAIERQYADALRAIGLAADVPAGTPMPAKPGLYQAASSGREIMQELAAGRKDHGPLLGAHVVGLVAGMSHGVAARSLRALGVDPAHLKSAADAIVDVAQAKA
ncbi:MAG TPA: Clp protease N-terminal domain-containing protein [Ensifer sp.]|jgi:ATP-dependent Clp protease ATP-binding subunit ClpA|uniref:Clp protease N-terminal domain-containing protein n=1 Tax=Ensifer sp. TaxID=1872086 RepID=UPI002E13FA7A|nr:Clp protease N-terminal domain-containing protein [Ensifer sp.]